MHKNAAEKVKAGSASGFTATTFLSVARFSMPITYLFLAKISFENKTAMGKTDFTLGSIPFFVFYMFLLVLELSAAIIAN